MIGDGILDGDLVLLRPGARVAHGTIAAVCVGDDREGTLKRVLSKMEAHACGCAHRIPFSRM